MEPTIAGLGSTLWTRRKFIAGGAVAATGVFAAGSLYRRSEGFQSANVFVAKATSYSDDLCDVFQRGWKELGLGRQHFAGKSVLLKPNLVEPSIDAPHINTHPAFIAAVVEALRRLDVREVFVAEGPGHCRDTYLVLDESGVGDILRENRIEFVDLNVDDVDRYPNRGHRTKLKELHLPRSLRRADWIISLPKMKTHHWTGATLSMKNFFGVMPGVCYGWPKNVLHHQGIHESIVDIVSTVRPHFAIVDGIVGMEGDGPIMGTPKSAGLVVMGSNLPAVDATCCRLMHLAPERIGYLAAASGWLGPIHERNIAQHGESISECSQVFELHGHPSIAQYRA